MAESVTPRDAISLTRRYTTTANCCCCRSLALVQQDDVRNCGVATKAPEKFSLILSPRTPVVSLLLVLSYITMYRMPRSSIRPSLYSVSSNYQIIVLTTRIWEFRLNDVLHWPLHRITWQQAPACVHNPEITDLSVQENKAVERQAAPRERPIKMCIFQRFDSRKRNQVTFLSRPLWITRYLTILLPFSQREARNWQIMTFLYRYL